MNDVPALPAAAAQLAALQLERLNAQVATMRKVLVQLLQDVVVAESRLARSAPQQLLEANEQLVVSALLAKTEAEAANDARDEASRIGGLDPLTGLPNRTVLLVRFETAIFNAKRHGNRVAVLFLDLNDFKNVNDTLGHAAGDQALRKVAAGLSSLVRETDTVSRHGGDEFLVLLSEINHLADAQLVAVKVHTALAACDQLDLQPIRLSASIGISIYPEDGDDAPALIDRADAAMYLAKKQGPGGFTFHRDRPQGPPAPAAEPSRPTQSALTPHETAMAENEKRQRDLREANEQLVMAALGARELVAAATDTRRRHAELLAIVVDELSNPHAPIRLAAAAIGMAGAQDPLLRRTQSVIERQADKLSRIVRELLDDQGDQGDERRPSPPRPPPQRL